MFTKQITVLTRVLAGSLQPNDVIFLDDVKFPFQVETIHEGMISVIDIINLDVTSIFIPSSEEVSKTHFITVPNN
jgi:hypothetical protein